jgi:hypothetical protein
MPSTRDPVSRRIFLTRRFRRLARTGFAFNGLLHFLIGGVAIALAFGDSDIGEADQSGAFTQITNSPIGTVAIWAATAGLIALGLWQLTRAGSPPEAAFLRKSGRRISETAKGLVYLGLGASALVFALGGSVSSSKTTNAIALRLLETQLGGWILVVTGLSVFGSGIGFVSIGIRRSFRKLIRVPAGRRGRAVVVLGLSGYIAKGIALMTVGVLLVVAPITSDASRVSGLDGALRVLGELPFGPVWLVLIGVGLIQYGLFLVARAKLALL